MAVWAAYGRGRRGQRWLLKSVSVVSAERARTLAGARVAEEESGGAPLVVREYAALQAIPWWVEAPVQE
jgi:hypothetical protein